MDATQAMLLIKSIEPRATLELSEWTRQWYVSANIEKSDGAVLTGIVEHRGSPEDAVFDYLKHLQSIDLHAFDHVLVTRRAAEDGVERMHWRWNGAGFVNEPLAVFKDKHKTDA